jgi:hypothetical protein
MFQRSIGQKDHIHSPGVFFHNIGLWGSDILSPENWTLQSLSTIRQRLGHTEVTDRSPYSFCFSDIFQRENKHFYLQLKRGTQCAN